MSILSRLFTRSKSKDYVYTKNTVFIAIKRQYNFIEDDIEYLTRTLNGELNKSDKLSYTYRGVRYYTDSEILVTLSDIDRELLTDRIKCYDGLRIV